MEQWLQNPYFQYFCGETLFQWKYPCDPSDLVHFRNRIGKEAVEKVFQLSVDTRKDKIKGKDVNVDSTAQVNGYTVVTPRSPNSKQPYSKQTMRRKCRKRAAIAPIIGHVKQSCRMQRNYLKGFAGDQMNALLAAAGFNFRGLLNKIKEDILRLYIFLVRNNPKTQLIIVNSMETKFISCN